MTQIKLKCTKKLKQKSTGNNKPAINDESNLHRFPSSLKYLNQVACLSRFRFLRFIRHVSQNTGRIKQIRKLLMCMERRLLNALHDP